MAGTSCTAPRHGTRSAAHHFGCVCPDAVAASRRYAQLQFAGAAHLATDVDHRVNRVGSVRRVQSLYALGHRERDLAPRLGYGSGRIRFMDQTQRQHVFASTAANVDALFRALRYTLGPSRHKRERAPGLGYFTPDQWDLVDIDNPAHRPDDPAARHETWRARVGTASVDELCRTHPDPELWFSSDRGDQVRAVAVCMLCPVARDCLREALVRRERHGVWGGLREDQVAETQAQLVSALDGRPIDGSPELETALDRFTGRAFALVAGGAA